MNRTRQHPENSNDGWSRKGLTEALRLREIWQDSLKHENNRIRAMLQDAWFPYFLFIQKHMKDVEPGYELESNIYISDVNKLVAPSQIGFERATEPIIQITFYWVPEFCDEDNSNIEVEFEIRPVKLTKNQTTYITKVMDKFSATILLPVKMLYE
jgi:hypothetical protein